METSLSCSFATMSMKTLEPLNRKDAKSAKERPQPRKPLKKPGPLLPKSLRPLRLCGECFSGLPHQEPVFRRNIPRNFLGMDPIPRSVQARGAHHVERQRPVQPSLQPAQLCAAQVVTAR